MFGVKTSENIRAMLDSVIDELAALQARKKTLLEREATLRAWLKEEVPISLQADLPINGATSPLAKYFATLLTTGKRMTAGALGELARGDGLIEDDVSPGRAAHGALMALQKHGHAKRHNDGTWSK